MEYVAFLFLALGVVLVLAGVILQVREKQSLATSSGIRIDEYLRSRNAKYFEGAPTEKAPTQKVTSPITSPNPGFPLQAASSAAPQGSVPGPFQFVENAPPVEAAKVQQDSVPVSVQRTNPRFFEKFAFLYLDSSQRNVYDGAGNSAAFDLSEVSGIRRFGRGVFAYDGFSFYFDHTSGQERFPLSNLKTVGFYPNCVALTFKGNQPVALLFMEETDSIRKVLETFRTAH
ncbi:MAG: hypothetical protein LDLANPLL_01107 [Turneriella sp.]|nr:hypothetical protein [Turneriella sp.]